MAVSKECKYMLIMNQKNSSSNDHTTIWYKKHYTILHQWLNQQCMSTRSTSNIKKEKGVKDYVYFHIFKS